MRIVKNNYHLLSLALIFSIALFLRFHQLSNIPNGLYPDETAIGYNAYSILLTGKDEYGENMPLYFRSFDDYKLPLYIYSTTLSIKLFGANAFAVRFPSAFLGSLSVIFLFFLVYELSKNKGFAVISSLFLALNPWHFFFSRAGYEVNAATALMLLGTLFFVIAVQRKNNLLFFIISIISFILAVYTYNVTRLIAPVIFFALIFLYLNYLKNSKKTLVSILILFCIGMIPFLVTFLTLQSQSGFSTHKDALIFGNEARSDIIQTRSYFLVLPPLAQKIFFNYWVLVLWKYLINLISFFSTNFFFTTGAAKPNQDVGGNLAMFHYFDFPLLLIGIYYALKKRSSYFYPFYIWFLAIFFIGSIIISVPNGTRSYPIIIPFIVFSAYGFFYLLQNVFKLKNNLFKTGILTFMIGIISYTYIFYFLSYFIRFPIEFAKDWRSEDKKTVEYIKNIEHNYDKIIFDESAEFFYTSLLFYAKYPPVNYQKNSVYQLKGLVNTLSHTGKYEFRKVDWEKEIYMPRTLIIAGTGNYPQGKSPITTFSYPTRPVVLYYDRKIAQFPTTDVAYMIFESSEIKK